MENHYTYRVEWDIERDQYTARCVEVDDMWEGAPTAQEALARIETAVAEHLRIRDEQMGLPPPKPLTEQNFSGRILVRTSRALHARLMIEAAEQGVSLNQWMVQKLAEYKPTVDW